MFPKKHWTDGIFVAALVVAALLICGVANAAGPTNDELKELLNAPYGLLALMFAASLVSGIKAITVAKANGSSMGVGGYYAYLPQTVITVVGNLIAFAVLVLTDQLNFASALGIGYGINSVTDLITPKTGRAGEIASTTRTS